MLDFCFWQLAIPHITRLYTTRFGQPRPAQKVFLVTCQQKDGWKALDQETSAALSRLRQK